MKKFTLTAGLLGLLSCISFAQEPLQKSTAMFYEKSATWCPNCGSWGWDLKNDMIHDPAFDDHALFFALYASSTSKIFSMTAYELTGYFDSPAQYPDFGVNGKPSATHTKAALMAEIQSFATTTPLASAASRMTINGSRITVDAKVKFWQAADGAYFLAAYLIEDGVMETQVSQSGTVLHRGVLRSSLSSSTFGVPVATGNITAGATYTTSFDYTIPDPDWDPSRFRIYTVLWKKNGIRYDFVNSAPDESNPQSVSTQKKELKDIAIYPNPASDVLFIQLPKSDAANITITVTDGIGRKILQTPAVGYNVAPEKYMIPISEWREGIYFITTCANGMTATRRFHIIR